MEMDALGKEYQLRELAESVSQSVFHEKFEIPMMVCLKEKV